ncbi:terpenoid synthase [Penicillium nucicola]|uniref:terpenoid synthase n=1 Tax=Penicillium nucicola TaxID=1850975 RepID=UPI002544FEF5|nr:terpenoid synthase [Penicillium nucicola]KAJ5753319.1 terpenoid synthase [Penicillium nucicola]
MPLVPMYPQDTVRETIKSRFTSELFSIPDLRPFFSHVPGYINPFYEQVKPILEQRIDCLYLPPRAQALKKADYALFTARWWPQATPDRLQTLAFFSLWLFTWDDKIDDTDGPLHKDIVGAHRYREETINFTRYTLGLPVNETETDSSVRFAPLDGLVRSFDVVGKEIQAVYTQEQLEIFANELEDFVRCVGREQTVRLSGRIPNTEEFWQIRMGSSGTGTLLALNEYSCSTHIPQSIMTHPEMRTLWDEVVINVAIANDILSLKKEIGSVDNIISVKVNDQDISIQDAICQAKDDLLLNIKRFDQAAEVLITDTTFHPSPDHKQGLLSIVEECRHNISANIDWSYTTSRYGLRDIPQDSAGWMHIEV